MDELLLDRAEAWLATLAHEGRAGTVSLTRRRWVRTDHNGSESVTTEHAWARCAGDAWAADPHQAAAVAGREPIALVDERDGPLIALAGSERRIPPPRPVPEGGREVWVECASIVADSSGARVQERSVRGWRLRRRGDDTWIAALASEPWPDVAPSMAEAPGGDDPKPSRFVLADARAALALVEAFVAELGERVVGGEVRLGRRSVASRLLHVARDPELDDGLPSRDAEGVPRRYQPLVAAGIAVGVLTSRARAAALGLGRSSGSLAAWHAPSIELDAVAVAGSELPVSCADLLADVGDATVLIGPLPANRDRAAVLGPGVSALMQRVVAVGSAENVALARTDAPPLVGRCPPMLFDVGDLL